MKYFKPFEGFDLTTGEALNEAKRDLGGPVHKNRLTGQAVIDAANSILVAVDAMQKLQGTMNDNMELSDIRSSKIYKMSVEYQRSLRKMMDDLLNANN